VSEKTEQPTPQKLRAARRKGQVARSRMLSSAAATVAGLLAFSATAPAGWSRLQAFATTLFLRQDLSVDEAAAQGLSVLAFLCGPALCGAFVGGAAFSAAQAGLQAQPKLLLPQLSRVSLAAGFKRLFSVRQAVDTLKNLAICAVVTALVWKAVHQAAPDALRSAWQPGQGSLLAVLGMFRPLILQLAAVVGVMALGDYLLARRRHVKDLMMSREEVKQEYKNSEGDPHSKAKRKSLHRSLANSGPARGVHKATAVVVNPTHIAVALRYDLSECEAPYLVASGRDEDALAIRREAKRQGIPVLKDIPLARSLIHFDVGEEVPEELYRAAAAILKAAMDIREGDAGPGSRTA
jgi:type III secretion protein U